MKNLRTSPFCRFSWWVMLALSLGVAGYASLALLRPAAIDFIAARNGLLRDLLVWHAIAGAIALALAPLQLHAALRARSPRWHRLCGRIYVAAVMISAVAGLALAPSTRGGPPAQAAFALLSLLWLASTSLAMHAILRRDIEEHRRWMLRSVAFTFAAVTLRIYLGLGIAAGLRFDVTYALVAWLSWVPNLIMVEWWWLGRRGRSSPRASAGLLPQRERLLGARGG